MRSLERLAIGKVSTVDRHVLADILLRAVTAAVFGMFAIAAISRWLAAPTRVTLLLFVVENCFTTGLALVSRMPVQRDWRPVSLFFSLGGTYGCMAYNLTPGIHLLPETAGASLQIAGIAWQLFAKGSLKRSFGVLPANRGVVSHGAYRVVRHPMYLGYFVTDIGFLLANFSLFNLSIHCFQLAMQVGRIVREERILETDIAYRCYRKAVRYRLIPMLF
ncbi:isoprenylcysteine carboxyl methyltransferase [Trinickia dabaoshanensis]|uniref:Isoprenylcysteine carboxyl methyltransferase n=1 Tax=Trinickia dabaoshanensis TaxID=564714 RepID=A0A2N7VYG9_9BURK|nr:isoprenylcysteine carboxylmethyltransferase family protein [Trinickia dabaoshanensis]PMS22195.1 isoprenylcysteine carboxyl methyltransferase [Trinickia dabaoshanensis]